MKLEEIKVIVKKYILEEISYEELKKAISLLGNPELNQKIKSILEDVWKNDEFTLLKQHKSKNLPLILQQIHEKIEPEFMEFRRNKIKQLFYKSLRIAAILLVGLIIGYAINTLKIPDPISFTSIAPKGSISQLVLPDSTIVYLNSGSEIKYTYSGSKKRIVSLLGEAFFQVNENKQKPFVVHTSAYDVEVTGTEFNVKAYKNDKEIVTTLVSGTVIIPSTDRFKMKKDITLLPGQQIVYNSESHTVSRNEVKTRFFTSWKDNKLIFINMNLNELLILLERKYGVDIEVTDKSILKYHYDGTIKNESILEVLEILKITIPIQYEIKGQKIQISKKGVEQTLIKCFEKSRKMR